MKNLNFHLVAVHGAVGRGAGFPPNLRLKCYEKKKHVKGYQTIILCPIHIV